MGHQDKVVKLNRTKSHREAMLANMAMSLFTHRLIKTTDARAKALRPVVDRIIVTAKKNTLASRRQVAETIHVKEVFKKLYTEILPHFETRTSGFTRVIKLGVRRGDGAPVSVVELLTPRPTEEPVEKDKSKKKPKSVSKLTTALKSARTKAAQAAGKKPTKAKK
jgi:large subunit ribosomal protein L17